MRTITKEYPFDDLFKLSGINFQTIEDGILQTVDEIVKEEKLDTSKISDFRSSITVKIELDVKE